MTTRNRSDGEMAFVSDADAARAIERQMAAMRERVQHGGVMEYLKPLGVGGRKDVNKVFLSSTIRSVDSHNRRHEEEKCWKIRELEQKLDDNRHRRRATSRSRSASHSRHSRSRDRHRDRSRSRSRSAGRRRRRRKSRSRSRSPRPRSNPQSRSTERHSSTPENSTSREPDEREFWAAKKAEKTKKMWENVYGGSSSVLMENAPAFGSDDDSDDEDERVHDSSDSEKKKSKKTKKHKKDKKRKKSRKENTR